MMPNANQSLLFCLNVMILAFLDWKGLLVSIFTILATHLFSLWVYKNRNRLGGFFHYFMILAFLLGLFLIYKFIFDVEKIPVFMFVSYVYLQCTGYLIEVLRGAERLSALALLNTNLFFLKAIAGPIERPHDFAKELRKIQFVPQLTLNAISLFILGALKKSLADSHYLLHDLINSYDKTTLTTWVGSAIFLSRIYCDFSGYTDMARGLAQMLGIRLSENFNHPFRSRSLSDFWARWHISLTSWFRDYVYTPLLIYFKQKYNFNSQNFQFFTFCASLVTFLTVGLWHNIEFNFVFWALLNALFLIMTPNWMKRPITILLIVILNVVALRLNSLESNIHYFKSLLGLGLNQFEVSPIVCLIFIFGLLLYLDTAEKFLFDSERRFLRIVFNIVNTILLGLVVNPMMAVVYGKF